MTRPPPCARCGEANAPFGIGPPLVEKQGWFCPTCNEFQPATQAALAARAREAIDD